MFRKRTNRASTIGAMITVAACIAAAASTTVEATGQDPASGSGAKTTVTLYPLLVRAPIMGASIDLPAIPTPSPPIAGGGDEVSGSTDFSLNNAWMAGLVVESNRWFAESFGLYAALAASRVTPLVSVDSNTYFFTGRAGVRVVGGLSATGGFRRVSADLDATLTRPIDGSTLEGRAKPVLWDPLIGLDWRSQPGGRWRFATNFQGGGFGVGTDVDLSAEGYATWRLLKHVELRAGYTFVYYKLTIADVSIGQLDRTLVSKQTLHGPEIGIGIPF